MPGRQRALFKTAPHRRRQRQEPQRVGDVAAALADGFGNAGLAVAEFAREASIGLGLFERREVFALQVFDQRDFERFRIAELPDDDRDLVQPNSLRGAPAALAGDQLEIRRPVGDRPHEQGLDDTFLADRLGEPVQLGLGEHPARLQRRGPDRLDWHRVRPARIAARRARAAGVARFAKKRGEAAPEGRPLRPRARSVAHAVAPCRNISAARRV